jgi:hypothetical protein
LGQGLGPYPLNKPKDPKKQAPNPKTQKYLGSYKNPKKIMKYLNKNKIFFKPKTLNPKPFL